MRSRRIAQYGCNQRFGSRQLKLVRIPIKPFVVPFVRPSLPDASAVSADFADIVGSNWFTNFGPKEREFAKAIASYVGQGTVATTFANATIALMASVQVLLGRGDSTRYVLIPSFTFAAGAEAIVWAGYLPLFVDIERDTLQPSLPDGIRALKDQTLDVAGILLCNTFGIGNAQIVAWEALAQRHSVPLIIDSAAGFGSTYEGSERLGSRGTVEVFSFHATKPFAIGEGGAVITRETNLDEDLRSFQNFGFAPTGGAVQLGLNGKLQEINAAIGLRQLEVIDSAIQSRRGTLRRYREALSAEIFAFPDGIEFSSLCFATILVPTVELRNHLLAQLVAAGVEARTYYSPALHRQKYFSDVARVSDLAVTDEICDRILSVPLHPYMAEDDVRLVITELHRGTQQL